MPSPTRHSASSAPASLRAADLAAPKRLPFHRYVLFFALATFGCAADLLTKHWVFAWRGLPRNDNEWWVWEPYFGIETALNTGALFGMGAGKSALFAALSVAAIVAILSWLFWAGAARDRWLTFALGCIMGGILGNLYDRLGLWVETDIPVEWRTAVRDWILIRYHGLTWPNFNIADSLLVCGAAMLLWHAFREQRTPPSGAALAEGRAA